MKKYKDDHRKVKIDYLVLLELLDVYMMYDGVAQWNDYEGSWSVHEIDERTKRKALNILQNS